jgi:hypothetical protein
LCAPEVFSDRRVVECLVVTAVTVGDVPVVDDVVLVERRVESGVGKHPSGTSLNVACDVVLVVTVVRWFLSWNTALPAASTKKMPFSPAAMSCR